MLFLTESPCMKLSSSPNTKLWKEHTQRSGRKSLSTLNIQIGCLNGCNVIWSNQEGKTVTTRVPSGIMALTLQATVDHQEGSQKWVLTLPRSGYKILKVNFAIVNSTIYPQMTQFMKNTCSTFKKLDGMRLGNQIPQSLFTQKQQNKLEFSYKGKVD